MQRRSSSHVHSYRCLVATRLRRILNKAYRGKKCCLLDYRSLESPFIDSSDKHPTRFATDATFRDSEQTKVLKPVRSYYSRLPSSASHSDTHTYETKPTCLPIPCESTQYSPQLKALQRVRETALVPSTTVHPLVRRL